ncbi:hypothetical protein AD39_2281 [Escherichia coli 1-182-04_S4_C3]|nr:hypothetical protein AD39_2281 [Escherichia coli 1-182-04_S4_C3]
MGASKISPLGYKLLPTYGAIKHFIEVKIFKRYLLNNILFIESQILL